ncbi:phage portal protein [uncultured Hyphomonas sp.]|uniref:phage portal protein n=1 Tax=uncultured Hyphomonas sp. TaxID=225298 RepID=UPI002AABB568|nr:phage portal protein [uncultured Hyphomonas sp.]
MVWNWIPGKNRHESKSAPPLVALTDPGGPNWGGRDGGALTRDGYLRNAVAYRCVRMVAEAAASVPLVTAHEAAARLIRKPAPDVAGPAFLEGVYTQLQLHGNAFIEAVRLPDMPDMERREEEGVAALYPLQPGRVRPISDGRGWAERWAVRERKGERILPREAVLHLKLFHPQDDILGLPALAPARRALDLHNASADWAKSLIDNSAKPSGALIWSGHGRMPPEQFDRLKQDLDALYSGAANAGRPLLLEGGLDWRPMSLSPADMDFLEARNSAAREIALALGVPPQLLGIPGDNTYANYKEANLAFWRMTVLPLAEKMAASLSIWLDEPLGGDVEVRCDLDRVPALSAEREALWARLEAASFMTPDEKRKLAGLG